MSIEDFVGQNVAEMAEFGKEGLRNGLRALFETYNARARDAGEKPSVMLKIPENL